MLILQSIVFCVIFSIVHAQYLENSCLSQERNPYKFFAKKTAYEFVHERETNRQHIVPDCRPVQYWSLIRYGPRLPKDSLFYELKERLPKIQKDIIRNYRELRSYPRNGRLCEEDLQLLERWHWNSSYDSPNFIATEAQNEMKFLAKRIRTKFDKLFFSTNLNDYVFKHTEETRNSDIYKAFIEGLFDEEAYRVQNTEILPNNSLKWNAQNCASFERTMTQATENEESEAKKFLRRNDITRMIKDVGEKLGYKYELDFHQLNLMYEMCRTENSINIRAISPWCTVFTKDQLKLFEYYYDLISYYQSGYGNSHSSDLGCHHVKDMLEYFQRVTNRESDAPKSIISFTQSEQLEALLVALDFVKDSISLTADNYNTFRKNAWRASDISPFGGNLAAVMYECVNSRYKVMFFINEKPVEYFECQVGLCDWDMLSRRLRSVTDRCNYDFCHTSSASKLTQTLSVMLILPLCLISLKKFIL